METDFDIRKAEDREIDSLMDIYLDKVRRLRERGTPMWDESLFTRESLKKKYLDPDYYVAVKDGEIIGGFILIEYDGRYWPENKADNAYYFHKFVIKNEYCGKGYSGRILRWVQAYAGAKGKRFLRLDFDEHRTYLKNMYLSNGFIPTDRKPNEMGIQVTKAEYIIGT